MYAQSEGGLNEDNPHYLRIHIADPAGFGIVNTGFRGMGVKEGAEYLFSAWVRINGAAAQSVHATVVTPKGGKIGEATFSGFGGQWKRYETTLKSSATEPKAQLQLAFGDKGDIDLDMISLYPMDTYKNRPNGLRPDLVQLLADMKPGFMRFPGGCIVEGRRLALRYQWKKTVGDVSERKTIINRWNDEFSSTRPTPDYYQSYGLGFYEYFQLAEDIGASPLPVLNCGMACQFNSNEMVPLDKLDPYIQDALDLIEFANGPAGTKWGGLRAKMGHPEPFNLKMIGVGNEQWGQAYFDRYPLFVKAIKAKHPEIQIVTGAGPFSDGKEFDFAWSKLRELKADIVDEHYYKQPQWFLDHSDRYDKYDRNGPRIFAGEYAAQTVERGQHGESKHLGRGHGGGGVYDGLGTQRGFSADGVLCAAVCARGRLAMDAGPDLVRQSALVWNAELLRAEAVLDERRKPHSARDDRRFHAQRAERALFQRRSRREIRRSNS